MSKQMRSTLINCIGSVADGHLSNMDQLEKTAGIMNDVVAKPDEVTPNSKVMKPSALCWPAGGMSL